MRILIINTDYPAFLSWLYERHPGLAGASYDDQMRARNESLFGVADFYSRNLRTLGHDAWDVHANNEFMQLAWAKEQGMAAGRSASNGIRTLIEKTRPLTSATPLRHLKPLLRPLVRRLNGQAGLLAVLAAQIRHFKPDVVLNQAMEEIPDEFLHDLKADVGLMAGQVASPLNAQTRFRSYDLVISSLPNFVDDFRNQGIAAELNRFAFETSILDRFPDVGQDIPVSFVGSVSSDHSARGQLLKAVAAKFDLRLWGPAATPAWGIEMYDVLNRSRMTLNHHISIARNYANNMRLFEATGMGTLLVTDRKDNLQDMFEPNREVAVYGSPAECIEIIQHYLENESERKTVARAGQLRTLTNHNYRVRMQELSAVFERHARVTT